MGKPGTALTSDISLGLSSFLLFSSLPSLSNHWSPLCVPPLFHLFSFCENQVDPRGTQKLPRFKLPNSGSIVGGLNNTHTHTYIYIYSYGREHVSCYSSGVKEDLISSYGCTTQSGHARHPISNIIIMIPGTLLHPVHTQT